MATSDDIDAQITLELDYGIAAIEFRKGVDAFIGLVGEITNAICEDEKTVPWTISVKAGSLLIGVNAPVGSDPDSVSNILDLASRSLKGAVTSDYPMKAVEYIRILSNLKGTRARMWVNKQRHDITHEIHSAISSLLNPDFAEYGTVEGTLAVLNARNTPQFSIIEPIWNKTVSCTVPEDMIDKMKDLWRTRIAAHGIVHYRPDGTPLSIQADEIEAFPQENDLPSHFEVRGIFRADP